MEITQSLCYIIKAWGRFNLQVPSQLYSAWELYSVIKSVKLYSACKLYSNKGCIVQSLCTTLKNFPSV